jgi:hypothetical protein
MILRCTNSKSNGYDRYGGRGIRVCKEWSGAGGFSNFLKDMGERPDNTTLERIDNDGHYDPTNCRWAENADQRRNRHNAKLITFKGQTLTAAEWAREVGTHRNNILRRLQRGLPLDQVLTP